jgi:ABC-type transport system involved in multi-copper enzyme maturation permease subunit
MNKILAVSGIVFKELYRRKDFYVLSGSVRFFDDARIVRYLREICLLLIWISSLVVAVTTAARQIPMERENRTIFPLLAKPISRHQVLLGKFLGCWLAAGAALLLFYTFFAVVSASREHAFAFGNYAQALWMHWQVLGIVVALTILGSIVLSTPAANVTIVFIVSFGILFVGPFLNKIAAKMTEPSSTILSALYFIIPHLEFYDLRGRLVHDWPLVPWIYILFATIYAWVYMVFFLFAGCAAFRRRALN